MDKQEFALTGTDVLQAVGEWLVHKGRLKGYENGKTISVHMKDVSGWFAQEPMYKVTVEEDK